MQSPGTRHLLDGFADDIAGVGQRAADTPPGPSPVDASCNRATRVAPSRDRMRAWYLRIEHLDLEQQNAEPGQPWAVSSSRPPRLIPPDSHRGTHE